MVVSVAVRLISLMGAADTGGSEASKGFAFAWSETSIGRLAAVVFALLLSACISWRSCALLLSWRSLRMAACTPNAAQTTARTATAASSVLPDGRGKPCRGASGWAMVAISISPLFVVQRQFRAGAWFSLSGRARQSIR